ncbi:WD40 repeat domain-containing protein [Lentzea flava]|uniref:WD40 repeat domain-containing protein n=1 Tax=Lentzea flava TaxID=103732 RepID=UPI00355860A2
MVYGPAGLLAFGTQTGGVHLWQAGENATELAVLAAGERGVPAVSFSPDGKVLVAGSLDRALRSWDISAPRAPKPARELTGAFDLKITATAFSPDGAHLVVGSADSTLRVLDAASWTTVEVLDHPDVVTWAVFSDNGKSIVSAATDGTARVWKLATALPRRAAAPIFDTKFDGSGRELAVFAEGGVTLWDTSAPSSPAPLGGTLTGAGAVFSGAGDLSGDGNLLAAGTMGGEVHLLDVSDRGRPRLRARLGGSHEEVMAVAFSPDRSRLAAAGRDSSIRVWDVTGGEPQLITVLDAPREVVLDLDWNPAGTLLAAASADTTVYLFDLAGPPALRARLESV